MDRAQRVVAGAVWLVAASGCTMIGSPELAGPPAPPASTTSSSEGGAPTAEPPSRGGNMAEYEVRGQTYRVLDSSFGYDERGIASWYGEAFHGNPTSNGETFDMYEISAAHRSLPLPSWVRVTNLTNGRSLLVRINDRGPFHDPDSRIIDLSYAAAVELDIVRSGTASVRVTAVEPWQYRTRGGSD